MSNETATTSTSALLAYGASSGMPRQNPDHHGRHYVIVPDGYEVQALPVHEAPGKLATPKLRDAASFITYVNEHKSDWSTIYATIDPARFVAVFDDHASDMPDWREWRCDFTVPLSPEWKLWISADRKQMSQKSFAEFLQDNLPDVIEPEGAELLELALNFEASQRGHYISAQRLQDGSQNLTWKADNNDGGLVKLPPEITLSIPVFENDTPSLLQARLRFRIDAEKGALLIWYELIRPHKVIEAAFRDTWKRIAEGTGMVIYLGTPE